MKIPELSVLTPIVDFRCPFCKGEASAGKDSNGVGFVVHTMPPCKTFRVKSADGYLQAARAAKQGLS